MMMAMQKSTDSITLAPKVFQVQPITKPIGIVAAMKTNYQKGVE